jgi:hypothetical protein
MGIRGLSTSFYDLHSHSKGDNSDSDSDNRRPSMNYINRFIDRYSSPARPRQRSPSRIRHRSLSRLRHSSPAHPRHRSRPSQPHNSPDTSPCRHRSRSRSRHKHKHHRHRNEMTAFNGPWSKDLDPFKKSVQSMPEQYKSSFASASKTALEKVQLRYRQFAATYFCHREALRLRCEEEQGCE